MRHRTRSNRFGMKTSKRKSLFRNLVCAIVENEQIMTTLPRARAVKPILEKMVTMAKRRQDVFSLRLISSRLGNKPLHAKKIVDVLSQRYADRPGGYLRIMKCGYRHGDAATRAIIEFVDRDLSTKGCVVKSQMLA